MKLSLNAGCGPFKALPATRWVNVDSNPAEDPDVLADLLDLPFADDEFDRVYAGHVLEHLIPEDVPCALAELRRVSTGEILIVGPDVKRGAEMLARGEIDEDQFRELGVHSNEGGEVHRWDCSDETLQALVREAGLVPEWLRIVDVPRTWPCVSRIGWQCAVLIRPKETAVHEGALTCRSV